MIGASNLTGLTSRSSGLAGTKRSPLPAGLTKRWQTAGLLPSDWAVTLPNEPEWEKGARGGFQIPEKPIIHSIQSFSQPQSAKNETPLVTGNWSLITNPDKDRTYTWPDTTPPDSERFNVKESDINRPSSPGCFLHGHSPYGCEELLGNVYEWTRSMYQNDDR